MATNKTIGSLLLLGPLLLLASATAGAREAASASSCQASAAQPAIAATKAALDRNPTDLPTRFKLADAWSDAGCFNEALQVLQSGRELHPESKELETRLRVARSLVGEETYFENLDRANDDAKLKRDTFRCTTLSDLDACGEALRMKPDDPALLAAQGDALGRAQSPASRPGGPLPGGASGAAAVAPIRRAVPDARVARADSGGTAHSVHRYSNADPVTRSH